MGKWKFYFITYEPEWTLIPTLTFANYRSRDKLRRGQWSFGVKFLKFFIGFGYMGY